MLKSKTKIICYGDSNTWGQKPNCWEKYDSELIWTNILGELLRDKYEVINEGLCGRFAGNLDSVESFHNGLEMFLSHFYTNFPFDILIISLGTNDFKTKSNQSGKDIFENLMKYIDIVELAKETEGIEKDLQIVFVTPPNINEKTGYFADSNSKNKELTELLKTSAKVKNYKLIDISNMDITSEDGVHFDPKNHKALVKIVFDSLKIEII
jgi:lysophospholipase L1-like esterase